MRSRSSEPSVVLGAQRPRLCHIPEYHESAGEEAIEVAELAGLELDDWQQFVLTNSLGERGDGKWAARTVGLTVARQNGKGAILEARELYGLFVLGEKLINHTAHQQKTATNHFKRVLRLLEGVPEFDRRIMRTVKGKGQEAIELRGGQEIFFATRAGGGGRGLTADLQVYDEAMFLTEQDRSSLAPTMAALSMHGNVQTWYAGSAVDQEDPSHDGIPFAQVRESGIAGAAGVAYFEWSAPGDDPSKVPVELASDPAIWALANPGLGIRISHEWVEHERTVEMGPRGFAVERLGIGDWPDTSEDSLRVISREKWAAAAEHNRAKKITRSLAFAVDVNPDQTWASVAVAGRRDDKKLQFAVIEHERGTGWLVGFCKRLKKAHPGARFVIHKRGPAAEKIEEFKLAKLRVLEASDEDYGRACGGFFSAVDESRAKYPEPQPELDDALAGARKQNAGDAWKWSRRNSTSADISPLVAVTLALWAAENRKRARVINPNDFVTA